MKENIIQEILFAMRQDLNSKQIKILKKVLVEELKDVVLVDKNKSEMNPIEENTNLLMSFLSAKKVEGCSEKTISYYKNTIDRFLKTVNLPIGHVSTNDVRAYLSNFQLHHNSSKVTIDNIRRIFSSFFVLA